jgi:MFS family permease
VLRAGAWTARGLRVPARNALLADVVPAGAYGRAYGFERAMDNLGAIGGPLLALGLVALVGVRSAILLSIIPGPLAAVAIVDAISHIQRPTIRARAPIRLGIRPVLAAGLGRLPWALSRSATWPPPCSSCAPPSCSRLARGQQAAAQLGLLLYTGYNLAATLASVPAGRLTDHRGPRLVLAAGVGLFLFAYLGFAATGASLVVLASCSVAAGVALGCVETAEHGAHRPRRRSGTGCCQAMTRWRSSSLVGRQGAFVKDQG